MNYSEVTKKIDELSKFGMNLGLERIRKLLGNMGNPQDSLKFIHIVGTNGKGSVSTMLSNILTHSGYQTGLFTSPSIISFREVMQINGEMISPDELKECGEFVLNHWENSAIHGEYPTQFEVTTAIAIEWFKRKKCDYICLEAGLGGGSDATNVIKTACMQIVTAISHDHTLVLGPKLADITKEKAGVIKGGVTVVYPLLDEKAIEIIKEKCQLVNSLYICPNLKTLRIVDQGNWQSNNFIYEGIIYHKSLSGEFQIYNAITAISAAKQLREMGLKISNKDIVWGVENTFIPARMEVLSKKPLVILDGSHNPGGAKALARALEQFKDNKIVIVMGVLADKDYGRILKYICKYATDFIAVTPKNPRALNCHDLAEKAKEYCQNVFSFDDYDEAISKAFKQARGGQTIVVCGSLYLSADIRPILSDYIDKHNNKD